MITILKQITIQLFYLNIIESVDIHKLLALLTAVVEYDLLMHQNL
ncbi:MAG: hypothetical protein AAF757_06230 [Cyanobacteria bacterium P01_D01_bin.116]